MECVLWQVHSTAAASSAPLQWACGISEGMTQATQFKVVTEMLRR